MTNTQKDTATNYEQFETTIANEAAIIGTFYHELRKQKVPFTLAASVIMTYVRMRLAHILALDCPLREK